MNKKFAKIGVPIVSILFLSFMWMPKLQKTAPAMASEEFLYLAPDEAIVEEHYPAGDSAIQPYSLERETARPPSAAGEVYKNGDNKGILKIILDLYKEIVTAITISFNAILAFRQLKSKKDKK